MQGEHFIFTKAPFTLNGNLTVKESEPARSAHGFEKVFKHIGLFRSVMMDAKF